MLGDRLIVLVRRIDAVRTDDGVVQRAVVGALLVDRVHREAMTRVLGSVACGSICTSVRSSVCTSFGSLRFVTGLRVVA